MNYKIKIITGYRKDQEYSISMDEAHRAYHLFLNPEERGVFDNGLALRGSDIQKIEPDYIGTMGWNATHELESEDWNELNGKEIPHKLRTLMQCAKTIAKTSNPQIDRPLRELLPLISGSLKEDVVKLALLPPQLK